MDLLFADGRLVIAGPDTGAVELDAQPGGVIVGVRFRAGVAPSVLGVPARHLLDARVDASEVVGDRARALADRLHGIRSAGAAAGVLGAEVGAWIARAERPNHVVAGTVALLAEAEHFRDPSVAGLAAALGVGERRLRRSCADGLGYGPQMFQRIVRLRRFVAAAAAPDHRSPAALALVAGYADQSHLTRECRALTGVPPAALRGYPVTSA
jgi:AraC-like DNA-binding protein